MRKLLVFVVLCFVLIGCKQEEPIVQDQEVILPVENEQKEPDEVIIEVPKEPIVRTVSLGAVGDIMVHKWQMNRAYNEATDSFDFTHAFKYMAPYLQASDYTVGNFETTMAGRNQGASKWSSSVFKGYSDYPMFNTPEIIAKNLQEAGFDLVGTANNHSLDSGFDGLVSTLDFLDEIGMKHVGTYRTEEESQQYCIEEINEIPFGFLSYTHSTNGLLLPKGKDYALDNIDFYNEERVQKLLADVKNIKVEGAEVVVVMIHYGNEYISEPDKNQKQLVDRLFLAGADVILGSHPHVLQPIEIRKIEEGDTTRTGVVIYSLGNFISSQKYNAKLNHHKDIGLFFELNFEKIDDSPVQMKSIGLVPTFSYWSNNEIAALPVKEVEENLDMYKNLLDSYSIDRIKYSSENTILHLVKYLEASYEYKDYKYIINLSE